MTLKPLLFGILCLFHLTVLGQEVGLQLNSFEKEFSVDAAATMKKVKDLGFSQIEMQNTFGLPFPQFIKLLAINGLSVISYETSFEKLTSSTQTVIDEARAYGAKYIVCSSPLHESITTNEKAETITKALNQSGKIIAQNGLLLCYSPKGTELMTASDKNNFDFLVQHIEPGVVYLAMDVYSIKQAGSDPVELLKKYPTRFVLVYLQDRKLSSKKVVGADPDANVSLGRGDIGIMEIMRTARELGIQHFFIQDRSLQAEQHISEGLAYLKTINDQTRK